MKSWIFLIYSTYFNTLFTFFSFFYDIFKLPQQISFYCKSRQITVKFTAKFQAKTENSQLRFIAGHACSRVRLSAHQLQLWPCHTVPHNSVRLLHTKRAVNDVAQRRSLWFAVKVSRVSHWSSKQPPPNPQMSDSWSKLIICTWQRMLQTDDHATDLQLTVKIVYTHKVWGYSNYTK